MEDAHLVEPNLTSDISLFAVFDGHGGKLINEILLIYDIYIKMMKDILIFFNM